MRIDVNYCIQQRLKISDRIIDIRKKIKNPKFKKFKKEYEKMLKNYLRMQGEWLETERYLQKLRK